VVVYSKNCCKAIHTTCEKNTELFNVQLYDSYGYHGVLSVKQHNFTNTFILGNRRKRQ
jgi:hypothetical protein